MTLEPATPTTFPGNTAIAESVEKMHALAASLANRAKPGDIFSLSGDLGAGKTTFVQGFVKALGGDIDQVHSPTFTLIHEYEARHPVVHMDAYRIESELEAVQSGMESYFSELSDNILLIEWPDRIPTLLPKSAIQIRFSLLPDGRRRVEWEGM